MKKYRASFGTIEELEVVRENILVITFKGVDGCVFSEQKDPSDDWYSWHDTKKEAKNWLIEKNKKDLERIKKL